jgi:hypothetical protein
MAFVQEIAFTNVILSFDLLKFHDVCLSSQTSLPLWCVICFGILLFFIYFTCCFQLVTKLCESDYWWKFFNSYFHLWANNVYPAVLLNFNFSSLLFLFIWFLNILINVNG